MRPCTDHHCPDACLKCDGRVGPLFVVTLPLVGFEFKHSSALICKGCLDKYDLTGCPQILLAWQQTRLTTVAPAGRVM